MRPTPSLSRWIPAVALAAFAASSPAVAAVTQVTNTATITSTSPDPDPTSNTSTVATAVQAPIGAIPTVSGLGLVALAVLLVAGAWTVLRRRMARA